MAPFVFGVMILLSPVGYPVAWLLRKALGTGDNSSLYMRCELRTLLKLHEYTSDKDTHLDPDEVDIMSSILDLRDKPVGNILTPIEDAYTLSSDAVLDPDTVQNIWASGHSRIPVHMPSNTSAFIGVLFTSTLLTYNPSDKKRVTDFYLGDLPEMSATASCLDVVRFFRERDEHEPRIILISRQPGKVEGLLGIVTLGDVIKGVIGKYVYYVTYNFMNMIFFVCERLYAKAWCATSRRTIVDTPEFPPSKYARHGVAARDSSHGPARYMVQPTPIHAAGSGSSGGSPTAIRRSSSLPMAGRSTKSSSLKKKKVVKDPAFQPLLPKMHEEQISPKTKVCAYGSDEGADIQKDRLLEYKDEDRDADIAQKQETSGDRAQYTSKLAKSSLYPKSSQHKGGDQEI